MQIEYEKPDVNGFIYRHFKNEKKLADWLTDWRIVIVNVITVLPHKFDLNF